jgi:DNA topoisomerase I
MIHPLIPVNPKELKRRVRTANTAGLRYVTDQMPGITRERAGKGFRYRYATGKVVGDEEVLGRIKSLAIPPAWSEVWICPDPSGHLQATGRDARGRKQNRYHPRWREVRDETKYSRMIAFGKALPAIRRAVEKHLRIAGLSREKVLATVVRLLEVSLIRVGNPEYARQNESFGLTTMRDGHVAVRGSALRFKFPGKSGKWHSITIKDKRLARIVKSCQDIPGQELFQYLDEQGERRTISSQDVNDYLRDISGKDFTAKDFRTWAGTLLAAVALREARPDIRKTQTRKNLNAAIARVAERLGNTPSVCRKCYVHPHVVNAYISSGGMCGEFLPMPEAGLGRSRLTSSNTVLQPEEVAVLALLKKQLALEKEREKNPAAPFAATLKQIQKAPPGRDEFHLVPN